MYDKNSQQDHPPICNLVPGYAFYNNMGSSLAENLVDLFEAVAELSASINRRSGQKTNLEEKPRSQRHVSSALVSQQDAS